MRMFEFIHHFLSVNLHDMIMAKILITALNTAITHDKCHYCFTQYLITNYTSNKLSSAFNH